jgi:peptidoglycan biosynthesis protein MviN/MurJ (putative lipid II flippase)
MAALLLAATPGLAEWAPLDPLARAGRLAGLVLAGMLAYFAALYMAGLRFAQLREH